MNISRGIKKVIISFLEIIGKFSIIPFSLKYLLFRMDRRFYHILPAGEEFVFETYFSDVKVKINTIYPIEKSMLMGEYDHITSLVLRRFLNEASIAIDIGANVGAITLQMAKIAGAGKVIAIEPGPPIYGRLIENLNLNPVLQKIVTVLQIGVSDQPGKLLWREDQNNRGNASLLGTAGVEVDVLTLDSIIKNEKISHLDFIKIDVEGMEYEVIKGGLASIKLYRPVIYYETLEPFRESRGFDLYASIFNMLCDIGYKHFYTSDSGEFIEIKSMERLSAPDILAIPAEKIRQNMLIHSN
jgi:FkbM family methyltransferase